MDDMGLWELNEAFAAKATYCRDKIGIPNENLNVNRWLHFYWTSIWNEWC